MDKRCSPLNTPSSFLGLVVVLDIIALDSKQNAKLHILPLLQRSVEIILVLLALVEVDDRLKTVA